MAKRSGGLRFQPSGGEKKPQIPTGKKQRLGIERLANDGRGIGFLEGRTWFVEGAAWNPVLTRASAEAATCSICQQATSSP